MESNTPHSLLNMMQVTTPFHAQERKRQRTDVFRGRGDALLPDELV